MGRQNVHIAIIPVWTIAQLREDAFACIAQRLKMLYGQVLIFTRFWITESPSWRWSCEREYEGL